MTNMADSCTGPVYDYQGPAGVRPDWQQRVIEEKAALDDKIDRLHKFFDLPPFRGLDRMGQLELQAQYTIMNAYSQILALRISRFPQP